MTDSQGETTEQTVPLGLQPVPGTLNLLDGDAGGCCGGGACSMPAPKTP
ncbi:hypothetical protein [Microbacterium sp. NPDC087665]